MMSATGYRGLLAAIVLVGITVVPVLAQTADVSVEVSRAQLDNDGATQLVVSVIGEGVPDVLEPSAFTVTEAGTSVDGVEVQPILESEEQAVSVVLLIDVSGSTAGEPLDRAKQAAATFVGNLEGAQVGLVAFNDEARIVAPLGAAPGPTLDGLASLEADGETALYDGVILAASLLGEREGIKRIVAFSDGADTVERSTLAEAVAAVDAVDADLSSVILTTPDLDVETLEALASRTGGASLPVDDAAQLDAAFEQIAREIASQYVLTYVSTIAEPAELPIVVDVAVGGTTASGQILALNVRDPAPEEAESSPPLRPVAPTVPLVPFFASEAGRAVGIAAGGAAVLIIVLILLWRPGRSEAAETLTRTMRMYDRAGRERRVERSLPTARITEALVQLVARVPKPEGTEERLQTKLDRADWPMRANEFIVLVAGAALLGGLVGYGLSQNVVMAGLGVLVGGATPILTLTRRIATRQRAFMEQLPGLLQLLAGSLEAGYGLLQAIDTAIREAEPPASTEFSRALTETRLGMPLEDALEGMAERLDNEDFRWVVIAINVQRQVGGNLAKLLSTVAVTVRERQQVRRQVRALSAEGRLSAMVVGVMPFVVVGFLSVLSPDYLPEFAATLIGKLFIGMGAVMLVIGLLWLRRMVRIEL